MRLSAVILVGVVFASCSARTSREAGLCAGALRAGDHRLGTALLHVPAGARRQGALVVVAHGDGMTGPSLARLLGMSQLADREGFAVLYPTAAVRHSWIGEPLAGAVRLLRRAVVLACVDPRRVTVAGFSSGATLAARLACRAPRRLAAAVTIAGYYRGLGRCSRGALSVIAFHGTADTTIPHAAAGIRAWLALWARRDGCRTSHRATTIAPRAMCLSFAACRAGLAVEHIRLAGSGHGWPGEPVLAPPGLPHGRLNATTMLWSFARNRHSSERFR